MPQPVVSAAAKIWEDGAFRAVDTSLRALFQQLTRAVSGLTAAYLAARFVTSRLLDLGDSPHDVLIATAVHVGLAGTSLFFTSARPIRRDLTGRQFVHLREKAGGREVKLPVSRQYSAQFRGL